MQVLAGTESNEECHPVWGKDEGQGGGGGGGKELVSKAVESKETRRLQSRR